MSRDWTPEEIQQVSEVMKAAGHMGFEEFCKELEENGFEEIQDRSMLSAIKFISTKNSPQSV